MTVKSGILGKAKPNGSALLFRADPTSSISAVLNVANSGTGAAYSIGLKSYDQRLNLDAGTYNFNEGYVISNYTFTSTTPIPAGATAGAQILSATNTSEKAIFNRYVIPSLTSIFVKSISIRTFTLTNTSGAMSVGDTITKGAGGDTTTCLVYEVYQSGENMIVHVGPETINGNGTTFADGDINQFTSGGSGVIASGGIGTAQEEFVFSTTTAGGVYSTYVQSTISFFNDRTYRFDTSDTSMSGRDFKLSDTINGEWGPDGIIDGGAGDVDNGTEFVAGKTTNGTAGSAGAYSQYAFTAAGAPNNLYFYDGGTGTAANANWGGSDRLLTVSTSYTYSEINVYNVEGAWTNNTAFSFNGSAFTLQSKTTGSYGYVRAWDPTGQNLDVILGENSAAFAGTDTFKDAPNSLLDQAVATVSSVTVDATAIGDDQYYVNGKTLAANATEKQTSIVLGPGESIVVNSASQHNTFILNGFSETSTEFTIGYVS